MLRTYSTNIFSFFDVINYEVYCPGNEPVIVSKSKSNNSHIRFAMTTNGKKKSDRGANHIVEIQKIAETHARQSMKNYPNMTEKEKEADSDDDDSLDDEHFFRLIFSSKSLLLLNTSLFWSSSSSLSESSHNNLRFEIMRAEAVSILRLHSYSYCRCSPSSDLLHIDSSILEFELSSQHDNYSMKSANEIFEFELIQSLPLPVLTFLYVDNFRIISTVKKWQKKFSSLFSSTFFVYYYRCKRYKK